MVVSSSSRVAVNAALTHRVVKLRHAVWASPVGPLGLWVGEEGLARLGLPNDSSESASRWVRRHWSEDAVEVAPADPLIAGVVSQLDAYFQGTRRTFDLALDMRGTPFQIAVWQAVLDVPWGVTCTYGQIAQAMGQPTAVRAVGAANGANPLPIVVPCHRILGSDGNLHGYGGGLALKEWLLTLEGR